MIPPLFARQTSNFPRQFKMNYCPQLKYKIISYSPNAIAIGMHAHFSNEFVFYFNDLFFCISFKGFSIFLFFFYFMGVIC